MKPLSREASDALGALKSPEPSAADEARVRKNLERTLGIAIPVAGVAVGASAASAQAATGAGVSGASAGATALSVGAKVAGFVFAVGLGTTLTVAAARSVMPQRAAPLAGKQLEENVARQLIPVAASEPIAVVSPAPAAAEVAATEARDEVVAADTDEVEVTVELPAAEPAVTPSVKPAAVRARPVVAAPVAVVVEAAAPAPAPSAVAPSAGGASEAGDPELAPPPAPPNTYEDYDLKIETQFPNCDPATEMRSALNARKLLFASRAEEAVGLLEAYQRRCPSGRWSNEAWTVRVGGLCMLGRHSEASGFLEWFSSESPERRQAVVTDLHKWCPEEFLKQ